MWRRDQVDWKHHPINGEIKGRFRRRIIDFNRQIGIYVLYDESRRPNYVGQTGTGDQRLFSRLRDHTRNRLALRWVYFSWFGLLAVNKSGRLSAWDSADKRIRGTLRSMLNEIEGVLIAATEPAFNKQGARFKRIPRYDQLRLIADKRETTLDDLRALVTGLAKKVDRLAAK